MPNVPAYVLEQLNDQANSGLDAFRYARFLKSAPRAEVWVMQFGKIECSVDWRIHLDGDLLTSPRFEGLIDTFRTWVAIQTHPSVVGAGTLGHMSAYQRISRAFRQMDYLLLHAAESGLAKYGLTAITANDIAKFLYLVEAFEEDAYSIYNWGERLADYLKKSIQTLEDQEVEALKDAYKFLGEIQHPVEEWTLDMSKEELVRARVFLWIHGMYKFGQNAGYKYTPRTTNLAQEIYRDTLWGKSKKPIFDELCLDPVDPYTREYEGVPVRTTFGDGTCGPRVSLHRATIYSLGTLSEFGINVPDFILPDSGTVFYSDPEKIKAPGRFRTPPFWQVMDGIKHGSEYALAHGDHLFDSYVSLMEAAMANGETVARFAFKYDVREFLMPATRNMGVEVLCLSRVGVNRVVGRINAAEFFTRMRKNKGLVEAIRVFYGSVQHTIGVLMARRQGEMLDLPLIGCLDTSRTYLLFGNRKSGALDVRQEEARPIPSLCVEMIAMVERFQLRLVKLGALAAPTYLFSIPSWSGKFVHNHNAYNVAFDTFHDYFESPLTKDGLRHYLRQHQLRRISAIAFFYGTTYGTLETLRWFLGHTDIEHLWHYITESMSGAMLREVQANFVTYELQHLHNSEQNETQMEVHGNVAKILADHVENEFGTRKYSVIDADALESYIGLLIKRGLTVTPKFFNTPQGKRHKIIVAISKGATL